MESLFDTINIRDLLSAQDVSDPTSPLSAPDLRLLIQRLESHSLHIKSKVQSYLVSHHKDFANLFSLCNDTVSHSHQISDGVSNLLRLLSDSPADTSVHEVLEEMKSKRDELKVKRELLGLVEIIVEVSGRLKGVRDELTNGKLNIAAERLRDLKIGLRIADVDNPGFDGEEPVVYWLLRKEWSQSFEEIQEVLLKLMERAVKFDGKSNRVKLKYHLEVDSINGIELQTVMEAMEVVGIQEYGLTKVADAMIKYIITPFLNSGWSVSFHEELNEELAVLKTVPSEDSKIDNLDGDFIYSRILLVIKFIYRSICYQNASWIQCFGRLMWPRISELIVSNFLSKVVPTDAPKLPDFQNIIKCTSDFETALKDIMFISASDDKDNRLSNFSENVEVHFAAKKKIEILAKARNLLLGVCKGWPYLEEQRNFYTVIQPCC